MSHSSFYSMTEVSEVDWLKPIVKDNSIKEFRPEKEEIYRIEKIECNNSTPFQFDTSLLSQWIVVPFVINNSSERSFELKISSSEDYKYFKQHVSIHFNQITIIYKNNVVDSIRYSDMKSASIKHYNRLIFEEQKLHPMIKDFYQTSHKVKTEEHFKMAPFKFNIKIFEIDPTVIEQYMSKIEIEDHSLWNYLYNNYLLENGEINLTPINWKLETGVKYSATLHYFLRFSRRIHLYVNMDNSEIRGLVIL